MAVILNPQKLGVAGEQISLIATSIGKIISDLKLNVKSIKEDNMWQATELETLEKKFDTLLNGQNNDGLLSIEQNIKKYATYIAEQNKEYKKVVKIEKSNAEQFK